MFQDRTIEKEVMKVVRSRIAKAQELYEGDLAHMKETHQTEVEVLKKSHDDQKGQLVDSHVKNVLGKLI